MEQRCAGGLPRSRTHRSRLAGGGCRAASGQAAAPIHSCPPGRQPLLPCSGTASLKQDFEAHELVEGVYASESTLHSSVAFLRNTLSGAAGGRRLASGLGAVAVCCVVVHGVESAWIYLNAVHGVAVRGSHQGDWQRRRRPRQPTNCPSTTACRRLPVACRPGLLPGA